MKTKQKEKEIAVEMRKQGFSYKEILSKVNVSMGSLSLWLKDITLTDQQKDRLREKELENHKKLNNVSKEVRSIRSFNGGKNVQKLHRIKIKENLKVGHALAGLAYRKDELPIKTQLKKLTGSSFRKERIGSSFCDFVNEEYIIEHTYSGERGLSAAIDRLNNISTSKIKVIITYLSKLGAKRLMRCKDIILLDINDFWNGEWVTTRYTKANNHTVPIFLSL